MINDAFSFRDYETFQLRSELDPGLDNYAVMLADITPLPEPAVKISTTDACAGQPIASHAVIFARKAPNGWNWCPLGPDSKEFLGAQVEELFPNAEHNKWLGLILLDTRP